MKTKQLDHFCYYTTTLYSDKQLLDYIGYWKWSGPTHNDSQVLSCADTSSHNGIEVQCVHTPFTGKTDFPFKSYIFRIKVNGSHLISNVKSGIASFPNIVGEYNENYGNIYNNKVK